MTTQLYCTYIKNTVTLGVATYTEPQLDPVTLKKGALERIVEPPFSNVNWC